MKQLTERQRKRRENILASARQLIGERGYEGVTMRELAARSGVAVKTLYLLYESKDKLLITAVEDLHRSVYQEVVETDLANGIDKLFYIIEAVTKYMTDNPLFSETVTPVLMNTDSPTEFDRIRRHAYEIAVQQIAEEGDLEAWVDVEGLTDIVIRHRASVNTDWARGEIATEDLSDVLKLHLCLTLVGLTRGATHARAAAALPELYATSARRS